MKIRKPIQQGTALVPCRTKGQNSLKKIGSIAGKVLLALLLILLLLAVFGTAAHAAGLVDDTVDAANEYSKYPLDNYQLDFYVDSGWDWLPWNWLDGIGKQVMYGLYAITNFIWTISLYLSNATGYLIQEAYSLDFISSTADSIGKNMQTLAGVTTGGLSSEGFYIGFLLILILVVGIYVAYTGLIKRETLFCDMDDYTVNLFSSEDTYPSYFHTFEMDGFTVRIENSLLAEALENLDGKKRDVILRYYFLGFDDTEISKILEVNRSTIQRRRHAGLEFIKKFMEEEA